MGRWGHVPARSASFKALVVLALLAFLFSGWMGSGQLTTEAWQVIPTDTPFPTETKVNLVTATSNPLTPTVTPVPATPTKSGDGGGVGGLGLVRQFYLPLISRSEVVLPTLIPTTTPLPTLTAPPAPPAALSRYMSMDYIDSANYEALYAFGRQRGGCDGGPPAHPDSFLILAFGYPWDNGTATSAASTYGVALYPDGKKTLALDFLERSLRNFIQGYYECVSVINPSASLTLGVGVNSSIAKWITYEHGRRWAQMVANLTEYIQSPPTWENTIKIAGAVDFEPGKDWSPSAPVRQWVAGYASIEYSRYYFYGACSGCPAVTRDASGNSVASYAWPLVAGSDWTMDDVWYLSYGARSAHLVPEIYETSRAHAWEWQNVADWAATCTLIPYTTNPCEPQRQGYYRDMYFVGAMTQYQACVDNQEDNQPCDPRLMNRPEAGWQQLWQALNDPNTPLTNQSGLQWSTDISQKH
jgi:hypothetical protein